MAPELNLDDIQSRLNIRFRDVSLLQRALTHRSYINEHPENVIEDNERLEFLGDAVLEFITGEWLYNRFPELKEGRLTRLRSALVRTEALAALGAQCSLGDALLLGHGEEETGGRQREANLCCGFEAFIGALYLDQGMDAVRQFVFPLFEPALNQILATDADAHPKSMLQEWSQAHLNLTPSYHVVQISGPDHLREFTVEVVIGSEVYGRGIGNSKKVATRQAAWAAWQRITASEEGN